MKLKWGIGRGSKTSATRALPGGELGVEKPPTLINLDSNKFKNSFKGNDLPQIIFNK